MALQSLGLGLLFTATDRASQHVVGLTRNVRGLEGQASRTSNVLQTGIGGAAAVALGAGLTKVVSRAAAFEFGLAKVQNIAMATAEDMTVLRDAAFEAGLKTQFSPTQAVEGLQNLAAAGFTAAESARLLDRSLLLAQAGQIGIGQSTATVATAIKLFNLQGRDQATLVDKLLKTTNLFKIQAIDLEQGLAKTAAAALLTNQSIDEMLLTTGLIKNVFPDAGEAGNSISRAMQNLAQKADKVKKTFGTDVIDPETGGFKRTLDLFIEIDAASKRMIPDTAKRAKELSKLFGAFGVKGFSAALASIDEFRTKHGITREEAAQRLRGSIEGAEGTADSFLKGLNATFEGQRIILEGAVDTLMVALGEPLLRILQPAVEGTAATVSNLARAVRDMNPALKETLGRVALVASGVLALGGAVALARVGAMILAPVLKSVAVSLVGVAIAAAPMLLIGATLGAAVAGLADAFGSSSESGNDLKATTTNLSLALRGLAEVVTTGRIGETLSADLDEAGATGIRRLLVGVANLRAGFISFLSGVRTEFRAAAGTLMPALSSLGSAFVRLGTALGLVAESGSDAREGLPSSGAFRAGAAVAHAMSVALEAVVRVMTAVIDFSARVATGIRGAFSTAGPVLDEFGRAVGTLGHNLGNATGAFANGESGSRTFGESLGAMIGNLLIIGVKLATVMTDIATHVVSAFEAVLPIVRPVFEFLGDHAEILVGLFAGKLAWSIGTKAVGALGKWGNALTVLRTGSLRDAQGRFLALPKVFRSIWETGSKAKTAMLMTATGIKRVGLASMSALKWVAALVLKLLVMAKRALFSNITSIATGIGGIGTQAAGSVGQVQSLQSAVTGLGRSSVTLGVRIATWAGGITAAAAAGWELGRALDNSLGLSTKIADFFRGGESEEVVAARAKALESEENQALKLLKKTGGREGRVISAGIVASLAEKEAEAGSLAKVMNAEQLGLTPQESAARTLLASGLGRTEQFDTLAQGARSRVTAGAQALRGGAESIPIIGDRIAAVLAKRDQTMREADEKARQLAEKVAESQAQVSASLAETNALLRANANRPVVLQGDGRELARFTQEGAAAVDDDLFGDSDFTGALD